MKHEVCKFFSGAFAGLAYAHGAYAVATSAGLVSEPVFRGRRWGVAYMWTEAVVYSAISLGLGYAGWTTKAHERLQTPTTATAEVPNAHSVMAGEQAQPISR